MSTKRLPLIAFALVASVFAVGCGAPGTVEGIFDQADFSLRTNDPLARASGSDGDVVVVLAEQDGETLRTVTVSLPRAEHMPRQKAVEVGPEATQPSIEVTVGRLTREDRGDGVEVISSEDATRAQSTGGTVTIEDLAPDVAGTFSIELDDGGHLDGVFTARMTED
jgi:hypothetical protein